MAQLFPFPAIVGQEEMKFALLIAAVDRSVGGVLAIGDRGTGKSTTIRAFADLLPPMKVVKGCRYSADPDEPPARYAAVCDPDSPWQQGRKVPAETVPVPVVDLPLGATEDRVVGALDLERALTRGEKSFEPGLLAQAHRGFLYIDEVNLLEDHLVDLLLDVATSGENIVEREGLSIRHPARFVLIGSGNPEEGELRPQLQDRFGLSVEIRTPQDLKQRVEVLRRREAFERDPESFVAQWEKQCKQLTAQITRARKLRPAVTLSDALMETISQLCLTIGSDGLRGELTIMRAAQSAAALEGKGEVEVNHVRQVAPMSLRHRLRRDPLDQSGSDARVSRAIGEVLPA